MNKNASFILFFVLLFVFSLMLRTDIDQVVLSEPTQVIETNQIPQIIYQQNAQPNQTMHTDGQIHYVVQEDDLPGDSYSLVQQPGTQQVFYQKLNTDTAPQLIQQHGKCLFIFILFFLSVITIEREVFLFLPTSFPH